MAHVAGNAFVLQLVIKILVWLQDGFPLVSIVEAEHPVFLLAIQWNVTVLANLG